MLQMLLLYKKCKQATMVPYSTHENHKITCYRCYFSIKNVTRPLWCLISPMSTIIEHVTDATPLEHVTYVTPLLEMSADHYGALFYP